MIYSPPSHSTGNFYTSLTNFELLSENISNRNPFVSITINHFNIRSKNWCSSYKTTCEGKKLESSTPQCEFKREVRDPTNILDIGSSCLDLIFILQPNLVMEWSVLSSLHPNCHEQIIHAKLNWKHSIHLHTNKLSDTIKIQIMILSSVPYPYSTGKELFPTRM